MTPNTGGGGTPSVPTYFEQGLLVRSGETVGALGPNLMGDEINEYSGSLEFTQTDVSLPGNNALAVAVGRHFVAGEKQTALANGIFGDWDIDIPHLHAVVAGQLGNWVGNGSSSPNGNRCSQFQLPPAASAYGSSQTVSVTPYQYWDGYHMSIPGAGDQTMLLRSSANNRYPTDGSSYPVVTKQGWQFSCLANLQNGTGEGFVAHGPDGSTYQFDHYAGRVHVGFTARPGYVLQRTEIWIMPTQVTDRFGNWVRYAYAGTSGVDAWKVVSITSSDGRTINIGYAGNTVQSVSDQTRTWTYGYDGNGRLQTITLPDASQWQFSLADVERDPTSSPDPDCDYGDDPPPAPWDPYTRVATLTHPSGATGTFNLQMTTHGRSTVPGTEAGCSNGGNLVSRYFTNYSMVSKTLAGPALPAMTWQYAYSTAAGSFAPCSGCSTTKAVTITDPQSNVTVNTYGTVFGMTEGLLVNSAEGWTSGGSLKTTGSMYFAPNAGAWPSFYGNFAAPADSMGAIQTPLSQQVITQQGVTFTQTYPVANFDFYARPGAVTRASNLGYSRSETTIYSDNTARWVMGQVASLSINGTVASSTAYDPSTALPTSSSTFGKLGGTYAFNADGTLSTVTDGLNQTTTLSNYMRGLPQHIVFADNTSMSAVVGNIGVLTSVTNEAGTAWSFGYDAMGRLASKTPPGGDPVSYNATSLSFVQVPTAEYGLDANHWRQTITTGNAVTVNYFDARWRKRLTSTYDATNPGATQRMQRFDYDPYNRATFAAYPARSIASITASTPGTATTYDALGRVTLQSQDSELGTLSTTTAYAANFQKQVTNPRGFVTTTAYQVYDEPSESAIATISAPEGVNVTISRDGFGKPTSIYRSGTANGYSASATRSYVYDGNQLLCKTVEPEIGATIQSLDAANNVAWRATGLGLTSTSSCDTTSVPAASKVAFTYDSRNRNTGTGFGDGSASIGRSYTADGLVSAVVSGGSTWNYYYNNRRLLNNENLSFPGGGGWGATRGYDANGHPSTQGYPDGSTVSFSPNALGEATQVSGYASGVTYFPNGAVAGYTLGNGIVHTLTQNTRGLPAVNQDAGVVQDQYSYDANGNISAITDQQEGISSRSMGYDGLDRLTAANAPSVWGNGSYGYDPLDNLRTSVVGSRSSVHNYNATTNRLDTINTNGTYTGYAYDNQGNVTGRGTQGFYFDQANRMQTANGVASYAYDGLGRRVLAYGSNGTNTYQMYSQDGRLLIRQPQGGPANNSFTLYLYLGGKTIAEYNSSVGTSYLHTDALGSPVAVTNASGGLISRTRYEAYGNTAAGTTPTDIGFTGHANDADTGLVYMQQRYYDPIAGRFQSVDPVVTDAATGRSFNRYEYVNSNPYGGTDPDGQDSWCNEPTEAVSKQEVTGSHLLQTTTTSTMPGPGGGTTVSTSGPLGSFSAAAGAPSPGPAPSQNAVKEFDRFVGLLSGANSECGKTINCGSAPLIGGTSGSMKETINIIKALPDGAVLTEHQLAALSQNVNLLLENSLPGLERSGNVLSLVKTVATDARFRFLNQVSGAKDKINEALKAYYQLLP